MLYGSHRMKCKLAGARKQANDLKRKWESRRTSDSKRKAQTKRHNATAGKNDEIIIFKENWIHTKTMKKTTFLLFISTEIEKYTKNIRHCFASKWSAYLVFCFVFTWFWPIFFFQTIALSDLVALFLSLFIILFLLLNFSASHKQKSRNCVTMFCEQIQWDCASTRVVWV